MSIKTISPTWSRPKAPLFLLLACVFSVSWLNLRPSAASPQNVSLEYTIDRSDLPPLNDSTVTLLVNVLEVPVVEVTDLLGNSIDYTIIEAGKRVMITTESDKIHLHLGSAVPNPSFGQVEIAPLRDNKSWAWSHSFDDNHYLEGPIAVMRAHELPATMYVVGQWIDQGAPWPGDMPERELHELMDAGWSLGNHTMDHDNNCQQPPSQAERKQSILSNATMLDEVISRSNKPDFRVLSFAVPCGGLDRFAEYDEVIREIQADGTTDILFVEGGHEEPFMIDVAAPFDFEQQIKRDLRIDGNTDNTAELIALFDELSQLTQDGTKHLWTNSFSHGSQTFGDNTQKLNQVATYFKTTYGTEGTNEAWMAPADEIYSYLLVRELVQVNVAPILPTPVATSVPISTPAPSATPSPTLTPASTSTATPPATSTAGPTPTRNFATSTPLPPAGGFSESIFIPFIIGNPASR